MFSLSGPPLSPPCLSCTPVPSGPCLRYTYIHTKTRTHTHLYSSLLPFAYIPTLLWSHTAPVVARLHTCSLAPPSTPLTLSVFSTSFSPPTLPYPPSTTLPHPTRLAPPPLSIQKESTLHLVLRLRGGGDLHAFFGAKNNVLVQYVDAFEAEGYEDVELVSDMDAEDCKSILEELDKGSIKKPHRKKLAKVLAALTGGGGDGGGGDNDDAGGVDVETWLTSVHKCLTPYAKVFTEMGYDNFDLIRDIDAGDRDDILAALDTAEIKKVRACWAHSLSYA
jgi:hypothetical protein